MLQVEIFIMPVDVSSALQARAVTFQLMLRLLCWRCEIISEVGLRVRGASMWRARGVLCHGMLHDRR